MKTKAMQCNVEHLCLVAVWYSDLQHARVLCSCCVVRQLLLWPPNTPPVRSIECMHLASSITVGCIQVCRQGQDVYETLAHASIYLGFGRRLLHVIQRLYLIGPVVSQNVALSSFSLYRKLLVRFASSGVRATCNNTQRILH